MKPAHSLASLISVSLIFALGCAGDPVTNEGRAEGVVVDALDGRPLEGVRVRAREGAAEAFTNAEGRFSLSLPAGGHHLWLERGAYIEGQHGPLIVPGGGALEVEARLFPTDPDESVVRAYLERQPLRRHAHPAHERPRSVELEVEGDVGRALAAMDDVELPDTIRVWRAGGTPLQPTAANGWRDRSCDPEAVVIELPREEYVKGVLPHEWIPSWHPESLRAGAIAARTYAVNWARRGGRWDCADLDDGTVTQVYRDTRSATTSEAVDATAGVVVVRDGQVFSTEYSAENGDPTEHGVREPTCTGQSRHGHGRGMCQWGSQRWATATCANAPCDFGDLGDEPKSHPWIVEHYYPGANLAGGVDAPPCRVLGPEGGVLDDDGPCFTAFGPPMFWREVEGSGYGGGLRWTNAFSSASPSNWARWRAHFERAGAYRVEVLLDETHGVYPETRYAIRHAGGEDEVIIDQGRGAGWAELGVFEFEDEGSVSVFDNYAGEVAPDQSIVADAVRFSPFEVDEPPVDRGASLAPGRPVDLGAGLGGCALAPGGGSAPLALSILALGCILARRRRRS